jgi:hypothetical protein
VTGTEPPGDGGKPPRSWGIFAQGGTWIVALMLPFVLEPPGHEITGGGAFLSWANLTRFVVSLLNGLALIAAVSFGDKAHLRQWVCASVAGLTTGIVLLAVYGVLLLKWTCETNDHFRVVIGDTLTEKAAAYAATGHDSCAALLAGFATNSLLVWREAEIFTRESLLGWLFVGAIALLGGGLITLIQAYDIAKRPLRAPSGRRGNRS